MFVGIGVGVGRQRFGGGGGFADAYFNRVTADGGTVESLTCVANASTLLQQASLLFIPSGYKAGIAYSALPNNGNGDLTWTRNSTANRTNSSGVIESVGANVPRLSYMYGSCPAALLEPQRTNLVFPSATATTQSRTVTAVAHTLSFWGTGSVVLSGAFSGTLNGTGANNRVTLTFTPTAGSLTLTVSGSVTNWQLEVGSYATTLIDTTTASGTRLLDTFSRNNIYTNGLIGASGGTWFVELNNNVRYSGGTFTDFLFIGNNPIFFGATAAISICQFATGNERVSITRRVGTTNTQLYATLTDNVKIAIKWNGTTGDLFVNGVKVVSAFSFTTTIMENLIGGGSRSPLFIQAMALFNTPLSDSECITLTT